MGRRGADGVADILRDALGNVHVQLHGSFRLAGDGGGVRRETLAGSEVASRPLRLAAVC